MIFTSVATNLAFVALVITNSFRPHILRQSDGLYYRHSTTNLLKVIDDNGGIERILGKKYACDWCDSINVLDSRQLMNSSIHSLYFSIPCPKCSSKENKKWK